MNNKNYNLILAKKCENEFNKLIIETQSLPIDEVINRSYERVIKADMLACILEERLTQEEAQALLCYENPLEYIYSEWLHNNLSCVNVMRASLNHCANIALREIKRK